MNEITTENINIFCCPRCGGDINFDTNTFKCLKCGKSYPISENIPDLFYPLEQDILKKNITEEIRSFYEENPFPSYSNFDSPGSFLSKAKKGIFAKLLDDQIPFCTTILECGCGTGQLTNFLSLASRIVIGTDISLNSLKLGYEFKDKYDLKRAGFYRMNLFKPCFKPKSFDLVIANGVLHHTDDPFLGFQTIAKLVKTNGYIIIGLYHKYGRIIPRIKRKIFALTKDKWMFLDKRSVDENISEAQRKSWFNDQYKNPHESTHTFGEVLDWLDKTGFQFIHSIPKTIPYEHIDDKEQIFAPETPGGKLDRFIVNLTMAFTGYKEGGFFIIIAKKKP